MVMRREPPRRARMQAASASIGPPSSPSASNAPTDTVDPGSKALVQRVFGEELGDKMALAAGYGKRKDYRSILEPTDAVAQCERAGVPFVPGMPCYLCGLPIPPKETLTGKEDELYVECEHILPVTEGRWFLDLYMATRRPADEWTTRAIQLEYAQSHRVCNQAKSNMSFVTADANGNPLADDTKIEEILKAIQKRARDNLAKGYGSSPATRKTMERIRDMDVKARMAAIRPRIEAIAAHATINPYFASLTTLARTAMLVDPTPLPNAVRDLYLKSTGLTREEIEAEGKRRLEEFRNKAYEEYPMFHPAPLRIDMIRLYPDLARLPPDTYTGILSYEGVNHVLDTYYNAAPSLVLTDQPRVVEIVYYGLYFLLFNHMVTVTPEPTSLLCTLHANMTRISTINKIAPGVFGPVPDMSEGLKSRCANLGRGQRVEERVKKDESAVPPTPAELAVYYLGDDFESALLALFQQVGVPAPEGESAGLATFARTGFAQAIADGYSIPDSLERIATDVEGAIRFHYLSNPAVANFLATEVSTLIRTLREGQEPSDVVPPEAPSGPAGAGAGSSGGNRPTHRRALYS
jgi:hypothetical protein